MQYFEIVSHLVVVDGSGAGELIGAVLGHHSLQHFPIELVFSQSDQIGDLKDVSS
jgi:hypothetical protein